MWYSGAVFVYHWLHSMTLVICKAQSPRCRSLSWQLFYDGGACSACQCAAHNAIMWNMLWIMWDKQTVCYAMWGKHWSNVTQLEKRKGPVAVKTWQQASYVLRIWPPFKEELECVWRTPGASTVSLRTAYSHFCSMITSTPLWMIFHAYFLLFLALMTAHSPFFSPPWWFSVFGSGLLIWSHGIKSQLG